MTHPHAWKVAHGSATGSRHQAANQKCQDYTCYLLMPRLSRDTIVAAVADGLGSAANGRKGARLAAQEACAKTSYMLWKTRPAPPTTEGMETVLNAAVLAARMKLEEAAARSGAPFASMSTTLMVLIYTQGLLAAAQVGDGAAVVSTKEGDYRSFLKPDRGEYANETTALTSRRALQHCQISIARTRQPLRELALTTDGLLNITMDMRTLEPHGPFFSKMGNWLRTYSQPEHPNVQIENTLASSLISGRTDDDVSLLVAVRTDLP